MKAEYTAEDFKGAIKNPFYHKLNKEVTVALRNEDYEIFLEIALQNGEKPESIMRRCLADYAKTFAAFED
jgi:hypothetical protein